MSTRSTHAPARHRRTLTVLTFAGLSLCLHSPAAGQSAIVDTTNPGFGTYLGPTYTVPSGGAAFGALYDGYKPASSGASGTNPSWKPSASRR